MDERRNSYGTLVNQYGKYVRNFESWCSEEGQKEEGKLISSKLSKKNGKKSRGAADIGAEASLPTLKVIKRYEGNRKKNLGSKIRPDVESSERGSRLDKVRGSVQG